MAVSLCVMGLILKYVHTKTTLIKVRKLFSAQLWISFRNIFKVFVGHVPVRKRLSLSLFSLAFELLKIAMPALLEQLLLLHLLVRRHRLV